MKKYNIYRVDGNGKPQKRQTLHAETIDAAWGAAKGWHSHGIFLVTNADGTAAKLFLLN